MGGVQWAILTPYPSVFSVIDPADQDKKQLKTKTLALNRIEVLYPAQEPEVSGARKPLE